MGCVWAKSSEESFDEFELYWIIHSNKINLKIEDSLFNLSYNNFERNIVLDSKIIAK